MDREPSTPAQPSLFTEAWAENTARNETSDRAEDLAARVLERRRQIRGLLLIGVAVLLASIAHAGLARAFYPGWWRQW
jgi:hypothetical protein